VTSGSARSISIAVCTYQGERYLREQLESLFAQTCLPQEIVVFDDASRDGTWDLVQEFARQAPGRGVRMSTYRNPENVGYVANFQHALRATREEIVFLCDQDDIWHPRKLERFVAEFDRRPDLLMLHSDARLVDGDGKSIDCGLFEALEVSRDELSAVHGGQAFDVLLRRNIVTGAAMAVRRRVFEAGLEVPQGWIHDEWLAIVAATSGEVDCLEEPTIDYRQHGANQIGARRRSFVERLSGGGMSRGDFMSRTLARTQTLLCQTRAGHLQLDENATQNLLDRLEHARFRAAPPFEWFSRLRGVLREYTSGRYARFSNGPRSAISDLLRLRR
jgi:hypothetical protein